MKPKHDGKIPSVPAIHAIGKLYLVWQRFSMVVLLLSVAGVAQAQSQSAKPIIVGSEEDFPPFSIGNTDETAGGFTVELWKAVAAQQDLNYTIRVQPFRQILEEFEAGKIDVLINLARSDERRAFADFSVPHVIDKGAIWVRRDESRIQSEADLVGKEIVVLNADLAHDYAVSRGWERQLVLVDHVADGLNLLASGKHDAMLLCKFAGTQTLLEEKIRNVKALKAKAGFSQKFSFAVKKGNSQLLANINEGLATIKSSGAYDALHEKWFGMYEVREISFQDLLKYLGPVALTVVISAGIYMLRQLERSKADKALRRSEAQFRTLTESAPILIYLTDQDGNCMYVNRRWCEAAGMTQEEAVGQGWLKALHTDDRALIGERWEKSLASGGTWGFEYRFVDRAGHVTWLYGTSAPIRDDNGKVIGYVGTNVDISATRQAKIERELLDRKVQETQKLESLGVLAGGIAHDFNNLLTVILGNASIAQMELPPGSSVQECLQQIIEASLRAADLCKQMLAYSGRGHFVVQTLDIGELVEKTTQMLQISINKKSVLRFHLEQGLPPVDMDATQLRQVIMNLVINASEAICGTSGVICISTGLTRVDRKYIHENHMDPDFPVGDYVFVEVSDNGSGMSTETQSRIFDPFFTTKFTGRGLGLAAVLGIVRGHKGAIKVDSALGLGTTFKLLFPAASGVREINKACQEARTSWLGKGTVLIVDDEEMMRNSVAQMMPLLGFDHVLASDGREAVEIFRASPTQFTLVLLDLTMPCMDGEQTFIELRRLRPDICVVLMSGFNAHEAMLGFKGNGLASFLQKPFTIASLRTTIHSALDRKQSAPTLADCALEDDKLLHRPRDTEALPNQRKSPGIH